ncbi:hypothetical protein N798_16860 [Knoellia flava TL1]|uniref:Uncharacterized protein n=2 Tax=Knoellia flava TaxID=913969 RepID=A0A8H9KSA0_9MICO|nr:hypothetical protein [Knoellia flava]KGN28858.1 hypothetical protein N798_16860 [Knoellia flava TL1]GGB78491.1 hypothetical protein GCM10011314_17750 [Knoellia flava]
MATATDLVRAIASARITSPHRDRLEFLALLDDRVWEVVGGGPLGLRSRADLVALNPQPLPPVDSGRLLLQLMARGIIVVGGRDPGAREAFLAEIDDWCGTGWPKNWPRPPQPGPDPDLRRGVVPSALLGGALAAAEIAASYPEGELQDLFAKAADQLTEAALA